MTYFHLGFSFSGSHPTTIRLIFYLFEIAKNKGSKIVL